MRPSASSSRRVRNISKLERCGSCLQTQAKAVGLSQTANLFFIEFMGLPVSVLKISFVLLLTVVAPLI